MSQWFLPRRKKNPFSTGRCFIWVSHCKQLVALQPGCSCWCGRWEELFPWKSVLGKAQLIWLIFLLVQGTNSVSAGEKKNDGLVLLYILASVFLDFWHISYFLPGKLRITHPNRAQDFCYLVNIYRDRRNRVQSSPQGATVTQWSMFIVFLEWTIKLGGKTILNPNPRPSPARVETETGYCGMNCFAG